MPLIKMVREGQHTDTKTKQHYAVYKEIVDNREILGQLILRGWTTPVPPFPERLLVHISQASGDDWRNPPPTMNEPIPGEDR